MDHHILRTVLGQKSVYINIREIHQKKIFIYSYQIGLVHLILLLIAQILFEFVSRDLKGSVEDNS